MNVFSRIKNVVVGMLGGRLTRNHPEPPTVHERRNGKLDFQAKPRTLRIRLSAPRGLRGPAFAPERAYHHASRQTCRNYLRGIFFAALSKQHPDAPRAQRRRVSRLMAAAEYRRMRRDGEA